MADTQQESNTRGGRGGRGGRGRGGRGRGARTERPANTEERKAPVEGDAPVQLEPRALFVAGFAPGTEAQEVGTLFSKFGDVEHVRLSARGVGRVVFQTEAPIQTSLSLNGSDYNGAKLRVEQHRRSRYPRFGRGRGRGRGRGARADRPPRAEGAAPAAEGAARPPRPPRKPKTQEPRAAQPPAEVKPIDPTRVFLGGLPVDVEDAELNELFGSFGLASLERSRNRRFAVAKFASAEAAGKAVAAKPTLKSGKAIRVEPEDPNKKIARAPRGDRKPRTRPPREPVDPALLDKKRVFVGFLPENTNEEALKAQFAGVNEIVFRGRYAYVTFGTEQAAAAAIAKNDTAAFGGEHKIKVEVANRLPRAPKAAASTA